MRIPQNWIKFDQTFRTRLRMIVQYKLNPASIETSKLVPDIKTKLLKSCTMFVLSLVLFYVIPVKR